MKNFKSTTKKGREGFSISYSDEVKSAKELLKALPKGWKVEFTWAQILFSDVQYELNRKKKTVYIIYNQNLRHWFPEVIKEIRDKVVETGLVG